MTSNDLPPGGVIESCRRIADNGLALLQTRLELFANELQEQKARALKMLMLGGAAVCLANLAVVMVAATIVVLAGERARVLVLVALCLLFVFGALVAFLALRRDLRDSPPPFRDTLAEIRKDRDWLNSRK